MQINFQQLQLSFRILLDAIQLIYSQWTINFDLLRDAILLLKLLCCLSWK